MTQAMRATLRSYWSEATRYQWFLYGAGALLLASGVFHLGVYAVVGGPWEGDISWRKPIVFGFSFGITLVFLAAVMTFLPRRRVIGWLLAAVLGVTGILETGLISMQQWRGVPSHFNTATPVDALVFGLMGLLIGFLMLAIFAMTAWTLVSVRAPRSLAWAIGVGMVLLSVGQVLGASMIANGSNVFGEGGLMKLPHALSLHAIEVLPVMAWLLLFSDWNEASRLRVVLVAAAGYCLLVAAAAYQTFSGVAPFDMTLPSAVGHGIGVILLAFAGIVVLISLGQKWRRSA